MPSYSSYLKQMAVMDEDEVQWITAKGNHIPIKKGQSKGDAVKEFFAKKSEGNKPSQKAEKSDGGKKKEFMSKAEYSKTLGNVKHILDRASKNEPQITSDLKSIKGIKLIGLDYRLKKEKSAVEKVKRERIEKKEKIANLSDAEIMDGMWDLVRYTQEVDKERVVEQAETTLNELKKKGYKVFELKNYWKPEVNGANTDHPNPYRGINVKLIAPSGQKVEFQFNTANNLRVKEKMHEIYNQQRELDNDSAEWKALNEKSLAITK